MLATSPTGLQLRLDSQPVTAPYSFSGVVGIERLLEAVSPQIVGIGIWQFDSWSNGGAREQTIATPAANTTFTATYRNVLPVSPFSANVDFQPATAPAVTGYLVDAGAPYGPRGGGLTYGWNANTSAAVFDRDSRRSPDQRYDTLARMQHHSNRNAVWEIAVPNGTYTVRVVSGDAAAHNSVFRVAVEGALTVAGTPTAARRWLEGTVTVAVSDGRLTVSNAVGSSNNKICFIEIAGG